MTIKLPKLSFAVYIIWLNGQVIYVGCSKSIHQRLGQYKLREYDFVEIIPTTSKNLRTLEKEMIRKHNPPGNTTYNANPPKEEHSWHNKSLPKSNGGGFHLGSRIKSLKIGESFTVATKEERIEACKAAKILSDAGSISFRIVTRAQGCKFTIAAIPC